jgi:hypothetical protein
MNLSQPTNKKQSRKELRAEIENLVDGHIRQEEEIAELQHQKQQYQQAIEVVGRAILAVGAIMSGARVVKWVFTGSTK